MCVHIVNDSKGDLSLMKSQIKIGKMLSRT